ARRGQLRYVRLEEFVGEADVAGFLGDVDLHGAPYGGRDVHALPQQRLLVVVDGFLAAEDADEQDDRGETARDADERRQGTEERPHARHIVADAVHQLLEHLDVVALLGHLVQAVAEFRGAVRQLHDVLHHPADEHTLEGRADLDGVGGAPAADLDLPLQGQLPVPAGRAERIVYRGQHPAWIPRVDREFRRVPVDVEIRIRSEERRVGKEWQSGGARH